MPVARRIYRGVARCLGLPLVAAELTRQARRGRVHLVRCAYLALLCFFFGGFWIMLSLNRRGIGLATMATSAFASIAWWQFVGLILGAAVSGGNLVAEERSRNTLEVLLSTPFSSLGILSGKFLSVLLRSGLYVLALLPMCGLLMLEGGISPLQILAVAVFTLCGVAWVASLAMLGSVLNRRASRGAMLGVLLLLFYAIMINLVEHLPAMLAGTAYAAYAPRLTPLWWLRLNLFTALGGVCAGTGPMFAGTAWRWDLASVMLSHLGIAAGVSLLSLVTASLLLRPLAQLNKMGLWRGLRLMLLGKRAPRDIPRRRWERGVARPWRAQPYVWRNFAPRASPRARRAGYVVAGLATVAFVFAPLLFFTGECVVRYGILVVECMRDGRGPPPLPEHPIMTGGKLLYVPDADKTVVRRGGWLDWKRRYLDSAAMLEIWVPTVALPYVCLLAIMVGYNMATALAREKEEKRFALLLATPLTDAQLAAGLLAQGLVPYGVGMFAALPVVALAGLVAGYFPPQTVMLFAWYVLACGGFFTALGLRFGLTASSVRAAQVKTGGVYLALSAIWPAVAGIIVGILASLNLLTGARALMDFAIPLLMGISPWALAGFIVGSCSRGHEAVSFLVAACIDLALYSVAGWLLFRRLAGGIRDYLASERVRPPRKPRFRSSPRAPGQGASA